MKRARFTEEQIIGIPRENEAGAKAGELARKHGAPSSSNTDWSPLGGRFEGSLSGEPHPYGCRKTWSQTLQSWLAGLQSDAHW